MPNATSSGIFLLQGLRGRSPDGRDHTGRGACGLISNVATAHSAPKCRHRSSQGAGGAQRDAALGRRGIICTRPDTWPCRFRVQVCAACSRPQRSTCHSGPGHRFPGAGGITLAVDLNGAHSPARSGELVRRAAPRSHPAMPQPRLGRRYCCRFPRAPQAGRSLHSARARFRDPGA